MIDLPQYIVDAIGSRPFLLGVDLYHASIVDSLHDAHAAGVDFAYLKIGEAYGGIDYNGDAGGMLDPTYGPLSDRCDEASVVNGGFWFLHANLDPGRQGYLATRYGRTRKPALPGGPGNLILGMDLETLNGEHGDIVGARAVAFENKVRSITRRGAVAYSSQSFYAANLLTPLGPDITRWIARYGAWPDLPTRFVQIADGINVIVEIPGLGQPLDVDIFLGTRDELIAGYTYQ